MKSQNNTVLTHKQSFIPPSPTKLFKTKGKESWMEVEGFDLLCLNRIIVSQRQEISSLNPAENEHKSGLKPEALRRGRSAAQRQKR